MVEKFTEENCSPETVEEGQKRKLQPSRKHMKTSKFFRKCKKLIDCYHNVIRANKQKFFAQYTYIVKAGRKRKPEAF